MRKLKMVIGLIIVMLALASLALAQTPVPPTPSNWQVLIAGFINAVLVVAVVQFLKWAIPQINAFAPWIFPIMAAAIGPLINTLQTALTGWLLIPIDLSSIVAVFTGGFAVTVHQFFRQVRVAKTASLARAMARK